MVKNAVSPLDLNDPSVRATSIRQDNTYGEEFTIKENAVYGRRVRRWITLQSATGTLNPRFAERERGNAFSQRRCQSRVGIAEGPICVRLAKTIQNKISAS